MDKFLPEILCVFFIPHHMQTSGKLGPFLDKTFIGEGVWGTFVGNFVDAILKQDPGNCLELPGRAQVHSKHAC